MTPEMGTRRSGRSVKGASASNTGGGGALLLPHADSTAADRVEARRERTFMAFL